MMTYLHEGEQYLVLQVSGRLGGSEIARTEKQMWGQVPLQTLVADIRYGEATARTKAGAVGVKVWIYRGEIGSFEDEGIMKKERRHGPDA